MTRAPIALRLDLVPASSTERKFCRIPSFFTNLGVAFMLTMIISARASPSAPPRLDWAIEFVRSPVLSTAFFEMPVGTIVKEQTGGHVAGHEDVGPSVIVEIGSHYTQPVSPARLKDARAIRYIGECTVPVVV